MPEIGKWETTTQLTVLTGDITTVNNQNLKLVPDGTGIVQIGDAGTTNRGLNTNDDLFVSGKFERDGEAWFDGATNVAQPLQFWNDVDLDLGSARNVRVRWSAFQTNDGLMIGVECGSATASGNGIS